MFPFREEDPAPGCKLGPALPKLTYKSEALSLQRFSEEPWHPLHPAGLGVSGKLSHERGVQNIKAPKPVVVFVRDNRAAQCTPGAHGVRDISGIRLPL